MQKSVQCMDFFVFFFLCASGGNESTGKIHLLNRFVHCRCCMIPDNVSAVLAGLLCVLKARMETG